MEESLEVVLEEYLAVVLKESLEVFLDKFLEVFVVESLEVFLEAVLKNNPFEPYRNRIRSAWMGPGPPFGFI